jgi:hypothetical protein
MEIGEKDLRQYPNFVIRSSLFDIRYSLRAGGVINFFVAWLWTLNSQPYILSRL